MRLAKIALVVTWIRRLGSKAAGFRYIDSGGRRLTGQRALKRIDKLRVPPAWRDVHIASSPRSAIQAWGIDALGRRQYRYNERAIVIRELRKYHRVRHLAKELPRIRRALCADARARRVATVDSLSATVLRLIAERFCRVGGDRSTKTSGTFGITTLKKSHVKLRHGLLALDYTGKSHVRQHQVVTNAELAALVARQLRTPGRLLFRYRRDGEWRSLTARDVNGYIHRRIGRYSAKDFRTWGGTLRAATVLAELGAPDSATDAKRNVSLAMRIVSAELGNSPAICRASYVHPMVLARYLDAGETISLARACKRPRSRLALAPEERALIRFLDVHFPERRRRSRSA